MAWEDEDDTGAVKRSRLARGRLPSGDPNPIDVHVGMRIRLRRCLLGMTQEKLGAAIGLTFQQVQKYERGANRISASRLFDVSRVLGVPVSFFFDELPGASARLSPGQIAHRGEAQAVIDPEPDPMTTRETMELVRAYYSISAQSRRKVYELVKALGGTQG